MFLILCFVQTLQDIVRAGSAMAGGTQSVLVSNNPLQAERGRDGLPGSTQALQTKEPLHAQLSPPTPSPSSQVSDSRASQAAG